MKQDEPIQFQKNQLFHDYFKKCSELSTISKPFTHAAISQELSSRDLEAEFELLRALTETKKHKLKQRVNTILQNKKNRYPEQSIYEHSRVKLEQSEGEGYINANWIPLSDSRKLIITQGPLEQTQEQFEQMIRENEIECVVMLCNIIENGKVRCFDYTQNREKDSDEHENKAVTLSQVIIQNGSYLHLHYSEWPDRSVPENFEEIDQILSQMLKYQRIVIHCSAGLGRSGVIAALLSLLLDLKSKGEVSVFMTALRLREHRFGAIQNNEQYSYIYHYLKYLHS